MNLAAKSITKNLPDEPAPEKERPRGKPTEAGVRAAEPVHKSLVRCLNDLDDLLDTIHDEASFAFAKPKLLSRAREQAAQAAMHPNAGMTQLGRAAAYEIQQASNRHMKSLTRAIEAVPAVRDFFEKEMGAILKS